MWTFVANAKRALWEFVELAFLAVLALMLIFLLLGIVIVLAIIYLALRRLKQDNGPPPRTPRQTKRSGA